MCFIYRNGVIRPSSFFSYATKLKCLKYKMALSNLVHKASGISDEENIFWDLHLRATYRFVFHPYTNKNTIDLKHAFHFSKLILKAARKDRRICLNLIDPDKFVDDLCPRFDHVIDQLFNFKAVIVSRMAEKHVEVRWGFHFFEIIKQNLKHDVPFIFLPSDLN